MAPPRAASDGSDAGALSAAYVMTPQQWQQTVLDIWLARDADGKFTTARDGLFVPRQNGKNAVLEMAENYMASVLGLRILHTAHEVRTCKEHFRRLLSFYDDPVHSPDLTEECVKVSRTNGQEGIFLRNGGSIEVSARTKGASRGFSVDVVVCDEAQMMTDEQLEAIMFTLAAAPHGDPKMIFTGTPPTPGVDGAVFGRLRKAAKEGAERVSWVEWSCGDGRLCDIDISDRSLWERSNPSLGERLLQSSVEDEFNSSSIDGFARERLCWWPAQSSAAIIVRGDWESTATDEPADPAGAKLALGVKFSADGERVSVSIGAYDAAEGTARVELMRDEDMRQGIDWLVELVAVMWRSLCCVCIDGRASADDLDRRLADAGVAAPARQIATPAIAMDSASMFLNMTRERKITHAASGQKALDESVLGAVKRRIGTNGGFGFGGENPTPIESAALAVWAAKTSNRNPNRKLRFA